jgi:hypothetical protein
MHFDVVGHHAGVGPFAFTDLEVQALDGEGAGGGGAAAGLLEGDRHDHRLAGALDRELAADRVLALAGGLDGRGLEGGLGELGDVEPGALGTSASVSGTPKVALPVSMVKLTLPASGFFGSKLICASQLRNLPSTGTPIWCEVKPISLWAGTTFCWAKAGGGQQGRGQQGRREEGTGHGGTPVGDVGGGRGGRSLSRGRDACGRAGRPCR